MKGAKFYLVTAVLPKFHFLPDSSENQSQEVFVLGEKKNIAKYKKNAAVFWVHFKYNRQN